MTPLDKTLKRAIKIKGEDFVVTLTPAALKVTKKGHQRGIEMLWEALVSGERALAIALQASVGQFDSHPTNSPKDQALARSATRRKHHAGKATPKRA